MGFHRGARFVVAPDNEQTIKKNRAIVVHIDGKKYTSACKDCTYAQAVRQAKQKIDNMREL